MLLLAGFSEIAVRHSVCRLGRSIGGLACLFLWAVERAGDVFARFGLGTNDEETGRD